MSFEINKDLLYRKKRLAIESVSGEMVMAMKNANNVVKFLQYDLGALTPDEIPKKIHELPDSSDEK